MNIEAFRKRYDIDRLELTLENGKIVSGMSVQDRDSYSNCPAGWHAYELRTSDCDDGQICSIERRVVVNWWGCFFYSTGNKPFRQMCEGSIAEFLGINPRRRSHWPHATRGKQKKLNNEVKYV